MSDLLVKLYQLEDPGPVLERLARSRIDVRRALAPEKHLVTEWIRREFSEGWASEGELSFSRQPISCFVAVAGGKILGFACYDAACKGFFGPTGVDPAARRKGIGKGLLLACLRAMAAEGYAYAVIGWAEPAAFYVESVGAMEIPGSTPGIYRGILRTGRSRPQGGSGRESRRSRR